MDRIKPSVVSMLIGVGFSMALGMGAGPAGATISSITPSNGSTLTGTSQTFSWTGTGNTNYWLYVGTTTGAKNILDTGSLGTATSSTVNGLPTNGSTVYLRLWYLESGSWKFTDYTYTAFTTGGGGGGGTSGGLSAFPPWSQILPAAQRFVLVMPTTANPTGEAVLDKETGLVWQRLVTLSTDLDNAIGYCALLELGGRKGWHLPTLEQLASLVDRSNSSPALPTGHPFQGVDGGYFWTTTTVSSDPNYKWIMDFSQGQTLGLLKYSGTYGAWCVRGGQAFDGNTHNTLH